MTNRLFPLILVFVAVIHAQSEANLLLAALFSNHPDSFPGGKTLTQASCVSFRRFSKHNISKTYLCICAYMYIFNTNGSMYRYIHTFCVYVHTHADCCFYLTMDIRDLSIAICNELLYCLQLLYNIPLCGHARIYLILCWRAFDCFCYFDITSTFTMSITILHASHYICRSDIQKWVNGCLHYNMRIYLHSLITPLWLHPTNSDILYFTIIQLKLFWIFSVISSLTHGFYINLWFSSKYPRLLKIFV